MDVNFTFASPIFINVHNVLLSIKTYFPQQKLVSLSRYLNWNSVLFDIKFTNKINSEQAMTNIQRRDEPRLGCSVFMKPGIVFFS